MNSQIEICKKFKSEFIPSDQTHKLGVAIETIGQFPINGVRHRVENGTCGWYIWCGEELSEDPDFFKPLHVSHINEYLPDIEPYLGLAQGYRFLLANDYVDVWFDEFITE